MQLTFIKIQLFSSSLSHLIKKHGKFYSDNYTAVIFSKLSNKKQSQLLEKRICSLPSVIYSKELSIIIYQSVELKQ